MLDIQRDEAYASAVLIQLVKSLGAVPTTASNPLTTSHAVRGWLQGWQSLRKIKFVQRTNWKSVFCASPTTGSTIGFRSF